MFEEEATFLNTRYHKVFFSMQTAATNKRIKTPVSKITITFMKTAVETTLET
jgi:hypothetical protein